MICYIFLIINVSSIHEPWKCIEKSKGKKTPGDLTIQRGLPYQLNVQVRVFIPSIMENNIFSFLPRQPNLPTGMRQIESWDKAKHKLWHQLDWDHILDLSHSSGML